MSKPSAYRPTIGLEIHAELKTRTKMFCASRNDPEAEEPNTHVCPVCLAHPGTLPVINREAVSHVLRVGTALQSTLADYTEFDRKSYFYPDIPKGYQISQYLYPLVSGGSLNNVAITRVHLEEDTARSSHAGGESIVDFNRAGVPLMELVTEPVIHDAETAGAFARELQLLLRTLKVSDANLEKGEMRIEANVSVSKDDSFGIKVEVKNLNSFRSVERAISYEIERQIALIESGGKVVQETRGWDEGKEETFHQRFKEGSADYRYFPDPDLPKLVVSEIPEFAHAVLEASLPELPSKKRRRLLERGVPAEAVDILLTEGRYGDVYDAELMPVTDTTVHTAGLNFLITDIRSKNPTDEELQRLYGTLGTISALFVSGKLNSTNAKALIQEVLLTGRDPQVIMVEKGLEQMNDSEELKRIVEEVVAAHPAVVEEYKAGKEAALQYLVGQSMKATKGAANPTLLKELLSDILST